jgi:hypothetical protein
VPSEDKEESSRYGASLLAGSSGRPTLSHAVHTSLSLPTTGPQLQNVQDHTKKAGLQEGSCAFATLTTTGDRASENVQNEDVHDDEMPSGLLVEEEAWSTAGVMNMMDDAPSTQCDHYLDNVVY